VKYRDFDFVGDRDRFAALSITDEHLAYLSWMKFDRQEAIASPRWVSASTVAEKGTKGRGLKAFVGLAPHDFACGDLRQLADPVTDRAHARADH
jgi:hypothetical protein